MGDLSEHFDSSEFLCHCGQCEFPGVNKKLIDNLEFIRSIFEVPIKIDSGYRCEVWNKLVGGVDNSQHTKGNAADIIVKGVSPGQVADMIEHCWPESYGVGRYHAFTHFDVREGKARWSG